MFIANSFTHTFTKLSTKNCFHPVLPRPTLHNGHWLKMVPILLCASCRRAYVYVHIYGVCLFLHNTSWLIMASKSSVGGTTREESSVGDTARGESSSSDEEVSWYSRNTNLYHD